METLTFKTNIKCGSCVARVTPHLDTDGVCEWNVDTTVPEKTLTIMVDGKTADEVVQLVANAGFKAELKTEHV